MTKKQKCKSVIAILMITTLVVLQASTVLASNTATQVKNSVAFPTQDVYNMLYAGFEAGASIEQLESEFNGNLDLLPAAIEPNTCSEEWLDDARTFITENTAGAPATLNNNNEISPSKAKATSISHAAECAQWSINNNRVPSSEFANEAMYMFVSHYIDRPEYYWSNGDLSYLMDGENMCENEQYFAKWLIGDDRVAYKAYLKQTGVSAGLDKLSEIMISIWDTVSSSKDFKKIASDFELTGKAIDQARLAYLTYSPTSTAIDFAQDIARIQQYIADNIGTTRLSLMYDQLILNDNYFRNMDEALRNTLIKDTLSMCGSIFVSGLAGGITQLGFNILSFTISAYLDLFDTAAYAAMRYSFHARHAQRVDDYIQHNFF